MRADYARSRFPAHSKFGGSCKIPTIIYYDQDGKVRAIGAETTDERLRDTIEDEGWVKAEWFKLHMQPGNKYRSEILKKIPSLPAGKSAVIILSDFYRYLYSCAQSYITESYENGSQVWASVENTIDFVLSHPNGWEGEQQQQMRRAAVLAGLVPDMAEGYERIRFVTEGEASLHFCLQSGMKTNAFKDDTGVIIVDAGGGTIDLSAYGATSRKDKFEEVATTQCHLQGSVHVNIRAKDYLRDYLKGSKFVDDVDTMINVFDQSAKLTFDSGPLVIKFGSSREKDLALRIRSGQLTLPGNVVAPFFEPSISCIIKAVKSQILDSKKPIKSLFLVGGFSASEYLFFKLKEEFEPLGLSLCRPDTHVNKAVADGSVSFYLDRYISARVSRHTYGVRCCMAFNPFNPDHLLRSERMIVDVDGLYLPGHFSTILKKNVQVSETKEFRRSYCRTATKRCMLESAQSDIKCYRGSQEVPSWWDDEDPAFTTLCTIEADTKTLSLGLEPKLNAKQQVYFQLVFDIILSFGLTELKAQIAWMEDGVEKR
ncbi:hypothetical protein H0H81_009312 [Sphagnurus paluster]|uniref:Uncharacterized protein n=1 Tax=Sphagnurus paluster TaxID=117069 RepID=A0A9P7FPQ5_9AGAR|nr:hypothetical protein H0H81_009312 [Sphagnurus paluster]